MGNIEYIILLLCWLVKSNDCRGIQEVRLRTISLKGLPELQVIFFFKKYKLDVTNCRRLIKEQVIYFKKYHTKKESKDCRSLWRFSSYRLISCVFVFYREVFCISCFCLGFFLVKKFFLAFSGGLQHREVNCKLSVKYIDVINHAFTGFVSIQKVP